jgi:hypothetical protein
MIPGWNNFLDELLKAVVVRAAAQTPAVAIAYNAVGASPLASTAGLWRHKAIEANAADPYTVARIVGTSLPWVPVPACGVQWMTRGSSDEAAWVRGEALFNTLLDGSGRPLRTVPIPQTETAKYRVQSVEFGSGLGVVGVDEKGRGLVVFNTEIKFVPLA